MKFKINYCPEKIEYNDSIIIEGETIEEIRTKARKEEERRGWRPKDCWSEKIDKN